MSRSSPERCPLCSSMLVCVGSTQGGRRVLTCTANLGAADPDKEGATTMIPCNGHQRLILAGNLTEWVRRESIKWYSR